MSRLGMPQHAVHLHYVGPAELAGLGQPLLGVIGFSTATLNALPAGCPSAIVEAPSLLRGKCHEVWTVDAPVKYRKRNGIAIAEGGGFLFAVLTTGEAGGIERATYDAYSRLFEMMDGLGYSLLRVWNHIPCITAAERRGGEPIERYRLFNIGRHEAFAAALGGIRQPPAASGVGSHGGQITIYLLAGSGKGRPLENPRQISAYRYPACYGPRSPTFSRAMLSHSAGLSNLFLSGTASIVGHESRHPGDVSSQTRETVANMRALLKEARKSGFDPCEDEARLKVYMRRPQDLEAVRATLGDLGIATERSIFLHAEICRPELLLEIEAMYTGAFKRHREPTLPRSGAGA